MELNELKEQPCKRKCLRNLIKISQSDCKTNLTIRISNDLADKCGLTNAKFMRIRNELDPKIGYRLSIEAAREQSPDFLTIKPTRTEMHLFITIPITDGWPILSSTFKIKKFDLIASVGVSNEDDALMFCIQNKHIKKFKGIEKRGLFSENFEKQISKDREIIKFKIDNSDDFVKNVVPQILQHDDKVFNLSIKGLSKNTIVKFDHAMLSIEEAKKFLILLKDTFKVDLVKISGRYYKYVN